MAELAAKAIFASACTIKVRALCIYALLRLFRKRKMQGIRAAPRFSALPQNYRAAHSFFFRGEAARAAKRSRVFSFCVLRQGGSRRPN